MQNFLQGTGFLEPTLFFLGSYPTYVSFFGYPYDVSAAFLCTLAAAFICCFFMMADYSSSGIKEGILTKDVYFSNYYINAVLCAWDYCTYEVKSASLQHDHFVNDIKAHLEEIRQKDEINKRSTKEWAKLYAIRSGINVLVMMWLASCYYLIYTVAVYQMKEQQTHQLTEQGIRTFAIQFLSPFTIIFLNTISPKIFSILISFENYSARYSVNMLLVRNVFLGLSSIIVLVTTFHNQITCHPRDLCGKGLDNTCRTPRCWETFVGQQLYKLNVTDIFVYIFALCKDAIRDTVVTKFDTKFTRLLGRQIFFLPTEVLSPVYSQTILWLGIFYSPLLPAVIVLKIVVLFYVKKAVVLKFSKPSPVPYRASRLNTVFITILMAAFFAVAVVHFYSIENLQPSRGCSPFRYFSFMTDAIEVALSKLPSLIAVWNFLFFEMIFIPCILLLGIAAYFYWSVLVSQRELAKRLKAQLVLQSEDKRFLLKRIAELTKKKKKKTTV